MNAALASALCGLALRRGRTLLALGCLWAAAGGPAFAGGSNCMFQAKGLSMSFGTLDPSTGATVTVAAVAATLNANKVGDCNRNMTISADNGLNFSGGARNLKHTTGTDLIPYTLTGLPATVAATGNNTYVTFSFSGTIAGTAYANARAGNYSDTVLITVTP